MLADSQLTCLQKNLASIGKVLELRTPLPPSPLLKRYEVNDMIIPHHEKTESSAQTSIDITREIEDALKDETEEKE